MTAGYFPISYFPDNYFDDNYWGHYGVPPAFGYNDVNIRVSLKLSRIQMQSKKAKAIISTII